MKQPEQIFYFVKFGQEKYLRKLLIDGEVYFNLPEKFHDSKEKERGDANEGAEWIENAQITKMTAEHPTLGEFEFRPVPNSLSRIVQYNYNFLSYSLYGITSRVFNDTDKFQIDSRMLEFGDSALFIKQPIKFLNSVLSNLKNENIGYEADIVTYHDTNREGRIELTPFHKKMEHQHQMEYRIIIENKDNKAKFIKIGSIEDYSVLVSSESMIETIWEAKKKI